jgi:hypothetical protein
MSIQVKVDRNSHGGSLIIQAMIHERLTAGDYSVLVSELENLNEKRRIRIFVELTNFDGWTVGSFVA